MSAKLTSKWAASYQPCFSKTLAFSVHVRNDIESSLCVNEAKSFENGSTGKKECSYKGSVWEIARVPDTIDYISEILLTFGCNIRARQCSCLGRPL